MDFMPKRKPEIKGLYYITHIDNVPSILQHGILSHHRIEQERVPFTPIYDAAIVNRRQNRTTATGKSLWEYANLYFQARNPMLYRVLHEKKPFEVAVLGVDPAVLQHDGSVIATGNAASAESEFLPAKTGLDAIGNMWSVISAEWWNDTDGSKRKIMAECLVPGQVSPEHIHSIYVSSHDVVPKVPKSATSRTVEVVPEPRMFFRPANRYSITKRLSLVDGDMFFSEMQTLTVSVNTVGVMGKGLASRAKYQFPDVYVVYQDACRSRKLTGTRPYLYKRESYLDEELADDPGSLISTNAKKWFLLFATKKHWRDRSQLGDIASGLQWLRENVKTEGITSLAMPALGCGLGGLEWKDVGPVMCSELGGLGIPVAIYLPREKEIAPEYLSKGHLLGSQI